MADARTVLETHVEPRAVLLQVITDDVPAMTQSIRSLGRIETDKSRLSISNTVISGSLAPDVPSVFLRGEMVIVNLLLRDESLDVWPNGGVAWQALLQRNKAPSAVAAFATSGEYQQAIMPVQYVGWCVATLVHCVGGFHGFM
jgi:hypothetical protein